MPNRQHNNILTHNTKTININPWKTQLPSILVTLTLFGCAKSELTERLTAPPHNMVDMITEADTVWIVHKNSHNSQKNIHKLIRYDSCFYEISNGHRHLMMSNKNTRYAYTDNGNEYCVNISKSPDGQRVTIIFRTSPNNAVFLYSYHYTKDFKLLKIEVSDTVTFKSH